MKPLYSLLHALLLGLCLLGGYLLVRQPQGLIEAKDKVFGAGGLMVTDLTAMTTPDNADLLYIVDTSANLSQKITYANIKAAITSGISGLAHTLSETIQAGSHATSTPAFDMGFTATTGSVSGQLTVGSCVGCGGGSGTIPGITTVLNALRTATTTPDFQMGFNATTGTVTTSLTVNSQNVCLANGTNCPAESQGLNNAINVNPLATSTPTFFGGANFGGTVNSTGTLVTATSSVSFLSVSSTNSNGLQSKIVGTYGTALDIRVKDQSQYFYTMGNQEAMKNGHDIFGTYEENNGVIDISHVTTTLGSGSFALMMYFIPPSTARTDPNNYGPYVGAWLGQEMRTFAPTVDRGSYLGLPDSRWDGNFGNTTTTYATTTNLFYTSATGTNLFAQNVTSTKSFWINATGTTANLTQSLSALKTSTTQLTVMPGTVSNPAIMCNIGLANCGGGNTGIYFGNTQSSINLTISGADAFSAALGGVGTLNGTVPSLTLQDSDGTGNYSFGVNAATLSLTSGASTFLSTNNTTGTLSFPMGASSTSVTSTNLFINRATTTQLAITGLVENTGALKSVCIDASGHLFMDSTLACTASNPDQKDSIQPLQHGGLETVLALQPIEFDWKPSTARTGHDFGFDAVQAATVDERLVADDPTGRVKGFRYMEFTAYLTKAIQELNAKEDAINKNQDLRIQQLERENADLDTRLRILEAKFK